MSKYKKKWEAVYGPVPNGYHLHHKIPIFDGGTDDLENLECLTKEEHAQAHLNRYLKYKDFRDLVAYHLILNQYEDVQNITSSIGGQIGGNVVKEKKIGICTDDMQLRKKWASLGGKVGGKKQFENKIGIHSQTTEERKSVSDLGRQRSKELGVGFYDPKLQSELGKRGGVKNKGFIWINDGKIRKKYTINMQNKQPIEDFLKENPQYKRGKGNF